MNKKMLGVGVAITLCVAAAAVAAPLMPSPPTTEKVSSSLAVSFVKTANEAETAAFVALGSDAATIAKASGSTPAVAGEGDAGSDRTTGVVASDAAASQDVVALIVVAIENDVKAQVAAGVPTLSISAALVRASNTPNLSKNVAAAFGRVQEDLSDLFDQNAPGATVNRSQNGVSLPTVPRAVAVGAGYREG